MAGMSDPTQSPTSEPSRKTSHGNRPDGSGKVKRKAWPQVSKQIAAAAVASLICCAVLGLHARQMIASKSATFDETIYMVLAQGSRAFSYPDPRLASMGVAPLPIWVAHLPANWNRPQFRFDYLRGEPDDAAAIRRARWIALTMFAMPGVILVVLWLGRRHGWLIGLAGGLLLALSPSWIGHGSLATTDVAVATCWLLLAASATVAWRRPTAIWLIIVCLAWGTALAAKYSALAGLPLVLAVVVRFVWMRDRSAVTNLVRFAIGAVAATCLALMVTWMWHACEWNRLPGKSMDQDTALVPAPVAGVAAQWQHQKRGHSAYLLGEVRSRGWIAYFPIAMFCKSSPVELLGLLAVWIAPPLVWWRRRSAERGPTDRPPISLDPAVAVWIGLSWLVGLTALASTINLGHRYLLVLYPLAILFAVDQLARWRITWTRWLIGALVAGQAIVAVSTSPHFLAYFSPLVGGSDRGHLWLGDSNLDWGQDLPALRRWCQRHPQAAGRIIYFGTADPGQEGIIWPTASAADWENGAPFTYLAVSVTVLQEIYPNRFEGVRGELPDGLAAKLFQVRPVAKAGYSIWIFDLDQPHIRDWLRQYERKRSP